MANAGEVVLPYSIARRYYRADDTPFPIMQIGPGIFATNQATDYDWPGFKKQVMWGLRAAVSAYPSIPGFPLKPDYLELRYVDAFGAALVGTADFAAFLSVATNIEVTAPPLFSDRAQVIGELEGRLVLARPLKRMRDSNLTLDVASATRTTNKERFIQATSKIVTKRAGVPKIGKAFFADVEKWLESAHDIVSPLFREFVKPDVMDKFRGNT